MSDVALSEPGEEPTQPGSLRDILRYFLHLGTFGFGGPIALAGYMQRDLVERRGWITKKDYVDGLALAQLWALFVASAVTTAWTESEIIWLFVASGVVALVVKPLVILAAGVLGLALRRS